MPPLGFEPTTPAGELPQTYDLDRVTTETGDCIKIRGVSKKYHYKKNCYSKLIMSLQFGLASQA